METSNLTTTEPGKFNLNGKWYEFHELPQDLQQLIAISLDFQAQLDEAAKISDNEKRYAEMTRICSTHPANCL